MPHRSPSSSRIGVRHLRNAVREIIVDSFAGGGGASTGIEMALGRHVDIAINHHEGAILMHAANHPRATHYCEDVWKVDPVEACAGRPVGLMWLSPDCRHYSIARGQKPLNKKIRGLAWLAVSWAAKVRPRTICLENVSEILTWGRLDANLRPSKKHKGETFRRFVRELEKLGYVVEYRELRACDYGAPTTRKRLFLVARCDGQPIVWPEPTHGPGRLPYRTAADCIDWSLPCPSIFERKRPLAAATMRRIAKGILKYVVNTATPFIVPVTPVHPQDQGGSLDLDLDQDGSPAGRVLTAPALIHTAHGEVDRKGNKRRGHGVHSLQAPMGTVTASNDFALMVPTLIQVSYGERPGQSPRVPGIEKPVGTVVAQGQKHALVTAWLAKHYGGVVGLPMTKPTGTVTSIDHHSLVVSNLIKLRGGGNIGQATAEPLRTISAQGTHFAEVRTLLAKHFSKEARDVVRDDAATTLALQHGIVMINGEAYAIVDIGMRMLSPRELFRAQGFPEDYVIGDDPSQGLVLTKTAQVRMCGNSVCPPLVEAVVRANYGARPAVRRAA